MRQKKGGLAGPPLISLPFVSKRFFGLLWLALAWDARGRHYNRAVLAVTGEMAISQQLAFCPNEKGRASVNPATLAFVAFNESVASQGMFCITHLGRKAICARRSTVCIPLYRYFRQSATGSRVESRRCPLCVCSPLFFRPACKPAGYNQ